MKTNRHESASVLMTTILTISILTTICATSLYVAMQDANSGAQAASWQQALAGAESGVDQAIAALNTRSWPNWVTITGSVPNLQPSPGAAPTATAPPTSTNYNYVASSISSQLAGYRINGSLTTASEGSPTISTWTTLDTAGLPIDSNGNQWYRIRSTGTASTSGPVRVSNHSLDNDLRKISLRFDRRSNTAVSTPQATRSIEVIVQALPQSIWVRAITLKGPITMSGNGVIDSFDSRNPFKSTNGLYDPTKEQSHGDVGTMASGNSNLGSDYVYGNLGYSGPAVKNTTHVQGTISTPFNASAPATSDPGWTAGMWDSSVTQVNGTATLPAAGGTQAASVKYKLSQLNLSGNNTLTISGNADGTASYVEIWITGKMTTSGNGIIHQDASVHATYYVDDDITISGNAYDNKSNTAGNVVIDGVGTGNSATISGNGTWIGVVNAPGFAVTLSGNGSYVGALIGNTLTISGNASFHYDEALNANSTTTAIGNYAFASWFEDTR